MSNKSLWSIGRLCFPPHCTSLNNLEALRPFNRSIKRYFFLLFLSVYNHPLKIDVFESPQQLTSPLMQNIWSKWPFFKPNRNNYIHLSVTSHQNLIFTGAVLRDGAGGRKTGIWCFQRKRLHLTHFAFLWTIFLLLCNRKFTIHIKYVNGVCPLSKICWKRRL